MRPSDAVCRSSVLMVGVFVLGLNWMWLLKSSKGKHEQEVFIWGEKCLWVLYFSDKQIRLWKCLSLRFHVIVSSMCVAQGSRHLAYARLACCMENGWLEWSLCSASLRNDTHQNASVHANAYLFSQTFSCLIISCFCQQRTCLTIVFVRRLSRNSWNGIYLPTM